MVQRDGTNPSLWQQTSEPFSVTNSISQQDADVIVIGGGMTGVTTALMLQQAGKKCILMEANTLGFGTSSGTTAHLNTLTDTPYTTIIKNFDLDKAKLVARATSSAIQYIKSNINDCRIDAGFEECKAFLFSLEQKQEEELHEIFNACKEVGLDVAYSPTIPLPIPFTRAISVGNQAKFHPLIYLFSIAQLFEKNGGVILDHCRVTGIKEGKDLEVESEKGNFIASYVVYATHIPPTINLVHLRCIPYRSYAMAIRLNSMFYPKDLSYDMNDPYRYYRTQNIDGVDYLIAGGEDHKTGQEENSDNCFRKLESYLRKYFDIGEITQKWSSQYYETTDGLPYIGKLPGHSDNVLVATGYGGNGMVYSTIAAKIIKGIVLEREDELTHAFSPSRIKPVAGFKNFVDHNFDILENFAGKLLAMKHLGEFAGIAPGDTSVIKLEGQSIGIFKDASGALHAVSVTCTHMKCTVSWNAAEKSWDCPCHGARFSPDGKVLNGPANRDLEYINLELLRN